MILAIDIGNSRTKAAVFEQNRILKQYVFLNEFLKTNIQNCLIEFPEVKNLVVASVGKLDKNDILNFSNQLSVTIIDHQNAFPFKNLYQTPQTLGIDRMVLAAGAVFAFPNTNRLIIDAGTCVTYDFVDADNNYLGGAISPGLRLRYNALHQYTEKLPLLESEKPENFIGNSTKNAINSGIVNGLVFEIDGFIDKFKAQNSNFIIILTGGDTDFLANQLKNTIFANSNFLLESLNYQFHYKITQ